VVYDELQSYANVGARATAGQPLWVSRVIFDRLAECRLAPNSSARADILRDRRFGPTTTFCTAQKTGLVELAEVAMRAVLAALAMLAWRPIAQAADDIQIFMTRVRL
jgi:hypothetical protein